MSFEEKKVELFESDVKNRCFKLKKNYVLLVIT